MRGQAEGDVDELGRDCADGDRERAGQTRSLGEVSMNARVE